MMLRNDLIHHPCGQVSKSNLTKIKSDFEDKSYESFLSEEISQVSTIEPSIQCNNGKFIL